MVTTSLDKHQIRFLLLEEVNPSAIASLQAAGYTHIESLKTSLSGAELKAKIATAHVLGIRSRTQLTRDIFTAAHELIAVGCFCIGTNQVDLQAATEHGVAVFNAPYSNTRSVAELVLAEAIMLARGIPEKNSKAHRGQWQKQATNAFEVRGKRLGIVGYGNIGSQLSVLAESLGMDVMFYDVDTKLPLGNARVAGSLEELLTTSDIVSLHVPETLSTRWMIGERELAMMKSGSHLINASRGTIVDIAALAEALRSKHLLGAAIDVFPEEPHGNEDRFESPLQGFDNVILTPHIGGSTQEAQANIGIEVADKLIRYTRNGSSLSSVNFPEAALPGHVGHHRILHIHHNVPGILGHINQIYSDQNINISGQYLQTNDQIGYVVTDIQGEHRRDVLEKLEAIEGTIRCRVLY